MIGKFTLMLPEGSVLLHIDNQYENLTFWFSCLDSLEAADEWVFETRVTGGTFVESELHFIKTVLFRNGAFVLHVFMPLKQISAFSTIEDLTDRRMLAKHKRK